MRKPKLPNKFHCTGCMACHDACPQDCISFHIGNDGHYAHKIDITKCIHCHKCERFCPVLNSKKTLSKQSKPWAAWTPDDALRLLSSSGGVFAEIAKKFLQSGGSVIGATITGTQVNHIVINNVPDLYKLQGSKYLQSNTCGIYKEVANLLNAGKKVLFSGTGCQVAAIYNVVPKKLWGKLYTIDLICHGVPSRHDLDLFLKHLPKTIASIKSFRDKSWKFGYAMTCIASDGSIVRENDNYFYAAFNNNKTLRWSCYNCPFKTGLERRSDITIGDFWGAKGYDTQAKKGLSLCITHSNKGEQLLQGTKLQCHESQWSEAIRSNKDYYNPLNLFKFNPLRWIYPYAVKHFTYSMMKRAYGSQGIEAPIFFPLRFIDAVFQHFNYQHSIKSYKQILCKKKRKQ